MELQFEVDEVIQLNQISSNCQPQIDENSINNCFPNFN